MRSFPAAQLSDSVAAIAAGPSGPRVGAFFDLDGTLVAGFTATAHAGDRIRRGQASIGELLGILEASVRYRFGRMQFQRLLIRAAGYLRGEQMSDLDELGEQLFVEHITSRIYPHMLEIVRAHQERGHTVVLSSSALTIHAEPVARFLGITHVLCNHFELDGGGALTGDIVKPILWGQQKADAVRRYCDANDIDLQCSYFYADGGEDVALMSLVGNPRPVNPRPALADIAAQRGWPVLRVAGSRHRNRARLLRSAASLGWAAVTRYAVSATLRRG
jgi:HAD superfamily hydrolase (TIGR01490 family)